MSRRMVQEVVSVLQELSLEKDRHYGGDESKTIFAYEAAIMQAAIALISCITINWESEDSFVPCSSCEFVAEADIAPRCATCQLTRLQYTAKQATAVIEYLDNTLDNLEVIASNGTYNGKLMHQIKVAKELIGQWRDDE